MTEAKLIELAVKAALESAGGRKNGDAQRNLACAMAQEFELKPTEVSLFGELWKLYRAAAEYQDDNDGRLDAEITKATHLASRAAQGLHDDAYGHRRVHTVPADGDYVIFSDHHMSYSGCRQNFFRDSGNDRLYREVLEQYFQKGFTLIENGDVEELVIDEQSLTTAKKRAAMSFGDLQAERLACRARTLAKIIEDNKALYAQISDSFGKAKRLVRVAGNHDQHLQNDSIHKVFKSAYPHLEKPFDYVLLRATGATTAKFVVCHGHQFDEVSNPKYAPRLGEPFSETLGWVNQGADRQWKWTDGPDEWATGSPYPNNTVTSEASDWNPPALAVVGGIAGLASMVVTLMTGGSLGAAAPAAGALAAVLKDPDFWESAVLKHNVAWEYFENTNPWKAIRQEVAQGDEHFKMRHLDERRICAAWEESNPRERPGLVLGHSHEPRFSPAFPSTIVGEGARHLASYYYNTGSAGRFENLLWAIEIRDQRPKLVAWHRPVKRKGQPQRRVFTSRQASQGVVAALYASSTPVPL